MSYGYGRQNPFDERGGADDRQNPFDERNSPPDNGYGRQGGGRAPPAASFGQGPRPGGGGAARYNQQPAGRDNYASSNVEMSQLSKSSGGSLDRNDPNAVLNECRDIDRAIDGVKGNLDTLRMLQDRSLIEADATSTRRELDNLSASTMSMFRDLTDRVRMVKSVPEGRQPRNAAQVGRVERRLKEANQEYQQVESAFRKKTQDQMARQYRIVRPDASESEVRSAVEDTSGNAQVFQQALMQGNRMGEATSTLNAVRARQQDMQKIEQTLGELVQLFTDLSVLIEQQETQFVDISQKTEAVEEDTRQANVEIGTAVHTAVKTRKKKWICLCIGVTILVIIVVAVVAYIMVNRAANAPAAPAAPATPTVTPAASVKRSLDSRSVGFNGQGPTLRGFSSSKIVVPNGVFNPAVIPREALKGASVARRYVIVDDLSDPDP
ncbi:snare protein nsyn1 [Podospora conica]|nr:snare protein nsyn1 [Schizothecium conicum]